MSFWLEMLTRSCRQGRESRLDPYAYARVGRFPTLPFRGGRRTHHTSRDLGESSRSVVLHAVLLPELGTVENLCAVPLEEAAADQGKHRGSRRRTGSDAGDFDVDATRRDQDERDHGLAPARAASRVGRYVRRARHRAGRRTGDFCHAKGVSRGATPLDQLPHRQSALCLPI